MGRATQGGVLGALHCEGCASEARWRHVGGPSQLLDQQDSPSTRLVHTWAWRAELRSLRGGASWTERGLHEANQRLSSTISTTILPPPQHGSLHINCILLSIHWNNRPGCNMWRVQRRIPIDEFSTVCLNSLACVDQITNQIPNSPAGMRAGHQVSLPDTLPPLSFPTRPGSPILTGSSSEGSSMAEDRAPLWTSEDLSDRRMSFAQHLPTTADLLDAM